MPGDRIYPSIADFAGSPPANPTPNARTKEASSAWLYTGINASTFWRLVIGGSLVLGHWGLVLRSEATMGLGILCFELAKYAVQTRNLRLVPHVPAHLIALSKGVGDYELISGCKIANGVRDYLLAASPEFFQSLQNAVHPDPWKFGFAIFHTLDDRMIGMCGFTGPPDAERSVEIGYSIASEYQGKGLATEAAEALVKFAAVSGGVITVRAHTLAEPNASTRVLEKCGFTKTAEITDPEGMKVWRWELAIG